MGVRVKFGEGDNAGGTPPVALSIVTTSPLTAGATLAPYAIAFEATGGTTPYTWAVVVGAVPAGLTLAANGLLSGLPTVISGVYNFTVRVTDGAATTADLACALTIGQTTFSDTWNRADEVFYLGTSWRSVFPSSNIGGLTGAQLSGLLNVGASASFGGASLSSGGTADCIPIPLPPGITSNISQFAEARFISQVGIGAWNGGPGVCIDANNTQGYWLNYSAATGLVQIVRDVAAVTGIGVAQAVVATDLLRLDWTASTNTLRLSINGAVVDTVVDATYTSGFPGFVYWGNSVGASASWNDFLAGTL